MCENRVGALIVASTSSEVAHIKEVCQNHVPVIFIGGKTGLDESNSLTCDYSFGASLVVNYLYDLGHKDIALFTYNPPNNTIFQKEKGFRSAMEDHGLFPQIYTEGTDDDTAMAVKNLVEKLICNHALPTAIWCASDLMAIGVLNALHTHGLRVPSTA